MYSDNTKLLLVTMSCFDANVGGGWDVFKRELEKMEAINYQSETIFEKKIFC